MTKTRSKKKIRKGKQLSLINPKNVGRPAIHDKGIRHCTRAEINRPSPLHLTIKLNRAHIQNKTILKHLKYAISRARLQGLKIIHFSLEYDHVHLYAESTSNIILTKSMKALGVIRKNQIEAYIHKYYQKEYEEYRRLLDHLILYERELRFLV